MTTFEVRGPERVEDLLALVRSDDAAADLSTDELLLACHERGGVVMVADGVGAVAVAIGRGIDGVLLASVRLLIADPSLDVAAADVARGRLLDRAREWAVERSVTRIELGGGLPFSLWPGVAADDRLLAVAADRGYETGAGWTLHRVPVAFRSEPPAGVVIRRAVHDPDVALVEVEAAARWPRRSDEIARALDHGTCHIAVSAGDDGDELLGLATHSIARAGWSGPIVVIDAQRRRGIGRALVGQLCRDLMIAEFPHLVVPDAVDVDAQSFLASMGAMPAESYVAMRVAID